MLIATKLQKQVFFFYLFFFCIFPTLAINHSFRYCGFHPIKCCKTRCPPAQSFTAQKPLNVLFLSKGMKGRNNYVNRELNASYLSGK